MPKKRTSIGLHPCNAKQKFKLKNFHVKDVINLIHVLGEIAWLLPLAILLSNWHFSKAAYNFDKKTNLGNGNTLSQLTVRDESFFEFFYFPWTKWVGAF